MAGELIILPPHHRELAEFSRYKGGLLRRMSMRRRPPAPEQVASILAVGALYNPQAHMTCLSLRDRFWLHHTVEIGKETGFLPQPFLEVSIPNIANGVDFLHPQQSFRTRILSVNFIIDRLSDTGKSYAEDLGHDVTALTSPHHTTEHSWREAAERSTADWVVVFSRSDGEISGRHFTGKSFAPFARRTVHAPLYSHQEYPMIPFQQEVLVRRAAPSANAATCG